MQDVRLKFLTSRLRWRRGARLLLLLLIDRGSDAIIPSGDRLQHDQVRVVGKETDASIDPPGHDSIGVGRYEWIVGSMIDGHTGQSVGPRANGITDRREVIE